LNNLRVNLYIWSAGYLMVVFFIAKLYLFLYLKSAKSSQNMASWEKLH